MLTPLINGLGIERGLSSSMAVLCVSLTGLTNAAGRLIMASLSDKIGRINTLHVLCVMTIVCGLLLIFVPGTPTSSWCWSPPLPMAAPLRSNPAASTDFFGPKYSGTNYGVIMLALGLSSVAFNAISNALYSATGAYTMTFIMGAVTAAVSIVIYVVIDKLNKKQKAKA